MGTRLNRNEFKIQYPVISQGLFIFEKEKQVPIDQPVINLGQELSEKLLQIEIKERSNTAFDFLLEILEKHRLVTLTHIEILFTPSLRMNPVATLLSLCRNRKICFVWPGEIKGEQLVYEHPGCPEYYAQNYRAFIDTYIISGGM